VADQNEAESQVQVDELGETQQTALAALRAGRSFAQAAEEADVSRVTVYRWVQGNPQFRAAYNAWKQEMSESAQGRMLKLADKAVDVVAGALDKGNADVAVRLLIHMGAMRRPKKGRTDAEGMKVLMDQRTHDRNFLDVRRMTRFLLAKAGFTPADQRQYIRKHGYSGLVQQMMQDREKGLRLEKKQLEQAKKISASPTVPDAQTEQAKFLGTRSHGRVEAAGPWFEELERVTKNVTKPAVLHDLAQPQKSQDSPQQDVA
jgi:isopenicillin N synthase-like dioxygenase